MKLAEYLHKKGINQAEFAEKLRGRGLKKCQQGHVWYWLSGGVPRKKAMKAIKEETGKTVSEKDFFID